MVKNVADTKQRLNNVIALNLVSDSDSREIHELTDEVKTQKSNLVKSKRFEIKDKRKTVKKRVTFADTELIPRKISFRERFVQFFHYIWSCTRSTVQIVLSKFYCLLYCFSIFKVLKHTLTFHTILQYIIYGPI